MAADPPLGRLIERVGGYGLEVEPLTSVYEALARSIVYQQLTGKAAGTIYGRLCALGDGTAPPTPQRTRSLGDDVLRAAGLSGAKTRALKDLAAKVDDGALPDARALAELDDASVIAALTTVRGIGPWSAQMVLMFRLGRPDVLPLADYGVQKGFQRTFRTRELPSLKALEARGERWRPHRTMASWYLWRAAEGR
jgi:3-methyladenine DNA glycosylase/8-oxoguanine DNA glycosylase